MKNLFQKTRDSDATELFDEAAIDQVLHFVESESLLLISKSHAYVPHVRAQKQSIEFLHEGVRVEYVDMQTINQRRNGSTAEVADPEQISLMQRAAAELFADAVSARASDIHIRVDKSGTDVYYRVHNDLVRVLQQPTGWGKSMCLAIYHSMTDVSDATFEEGNRQDARIGHRAFLPNGVVGIRVATVPAVDGYVMVLRLLYDASGASLDLADLGYTDVQKAYVQRMMRRPTGIYLVTGPTGSGKSTTLQRVLTKLIKDTGGTQNVITVEDPPEYPIPGAVQSPVTNASTEADRKLAFQQAIKGAMRADPDVIMVGEIRDTPSARLALEAAMTGHQVWSTLHANGAFHIIDRLLDLGIDIHLLTDPMIMGGLISQRLVQTLCSCKKPLISVVPQRLEAQPEFARDLERLQALFGPDLPHLHVVGDGCPLCRYTGIIGRQAVAEVVAPDAELMRMLRARDVEAAITYWKDRQQGMTVVEHALLRVGQGWVDPFMAETIVGPLDAGLSAPRSGLVSVERLLQRQAGSAHV